jgi:hypothetical protein
VRLLTSSRALPYTAVREIVSHHPQRHASRVASVVEVERSAGSASGYLPLRNFRPAGSWYSAAFAVISLTKHVSFNFGLLYQRRAQASNLGERRDAWGVAIPRLLLSLDSQPTLQVGGQQRLHLSSGHCSCGRLRTVGPYLKFCKRRSGS